MLWQHVFQAVVCVQSDVRRHNPQKLNIPYYRRENPQSRDTDGTLLKRIEISNLQNKVSVSLRILGNVGNCMKCLFVGC